MSWKPSGQMPFESGPFARTRGSSSANVTVGKARRSITKYSGFRESHRGLIDRAQLGHADLAGVEGGGPLFSGHVGQVVEGGFFYTVGAKGGGDVGCG